MSKHDGVLAFWAEDHNRTLFPLNTARVLINTRPDEIAKFVYTDIASSDPETGAHFLPQVHAFADKSNFHLRRTLRLDPVAEFYLYDVVYRNRASFRQQSGQGRVTFGYTFSGGSVPAPSKSYREFSDAVYKALHQYKYVLSCDISSYFNSIYHHDLVARFRDVAAVHGDVELFGQFFREINAGRSMDCLPHGIVPAKILGSDFLSFADASKRIKSPVAYRFMDDFEIFSNRQDQLVGDFLGLQELLSSKGLFINPSKTRISDTDTIRGEGEIDAHKLDLLRRRRDMLLASDGTELDEDDLDGSMDQQDTEYLLSLLEEEAVTEEDAELGLTLLRECADDLLEHLEVLLLKFPSLAKNVYHFSRHVTSRAELGRSLLDHVRRNRCATEFQLFWIARIAEDYLNKTTMYGDLLHAIYDHERATIIVQAKILECPDKRFGLPELREVQLKSGGAGWLPWASAVGSICEKKATRNHLLGYFANASQLNRLFAGIIKEHPGI